ncbi:MAG TPA: c-type cytochrome, partial [Verrucomicrobiae bacterium]|nr:c-type cytochrome [Verrucomicrobiae bacterium]
MKLGKFGIYLGICAAAVAIVTGTGAIRHGFSARTQPLALEAAIARKLRHLAVPASAQTQSNPFRATPDMLAQARRHFADHCAGCHANDGSGKTAMGQNLYPKSPDMRLSATQQLSDGELYY